MLVIRGSERVKLILCLSIGMRISEAFDTVRWWHRPPKSLISECYLWLSAFKCPYQNYIFLLLTPNQHVNLLIAYSLTYIGARFVL